MDNTKLKGRMSGKVQELQKPVEVAAASDASLAPVEPGYLALTNNALEIIRAKPYALFNFEMVGALSPEESALTKTYVQQFMEIVNAAELVPELAEAS